VCPISNDGALCLAWLLGAFSPQFTAGTVWLGSKALGEVVGSAGSPGCPGSAPDGYVSFYIEFLQKIRNEKKFESKDYLIKQIEDDKEVCIKLIDSFKEKYEV
jgi:hypothetical protein